MPEPRSTRRAFASFWDGTALGPIEMASIQSFLRSGHQLSVFAYAPLLDLPEGVTWECAQQILPAEKLVRYARNGSAALHANLFRYQLLKKTDFLWTDLDVVARRPLDFASAHVFAWQGDGRVNNAVLGLPQDSAALDVMAGFTAETTGVPPHVTGLRRLKYQLRHTLSGGLGIVNWPWGSLGPDGLTHALQHSGEIVHAMPELSFYSVGVGDFARFADPHALRDEDLPEQALALHLWNNRLRRYLADRHDGVPPKGSYLHGLLHG